MVTVPEIDVAKLLTENLIPPWIDLVRGAVAASRPTTIDLTRIDGWFGAKWLGFSGKVLGAVGRHDRDRLAVPAFHPNRVMSTITVERRAGSDGWTVAETAPALHRELASQDNTTRRLRKFRPPGTLLIWHGTSVDMRSSLMVYSLGVDGDLSWHVELDLTASPIRQHGTGITDQELSVLRRLATAGGGAAG